LIRKQNGLVRVCAAVMDSGDFVVITRWDDNKSMENWNSNSEHKNIVKDLLPLLSAELSSEVYNYIGFDS